MRAVNGDGVFLTKTGHLSAVPQMPSEALPSVEPENPRQFESVTVSESLMDGDMRAALFDASYDNGELQDDIVALASIIPEGEEDKAAAFDYDAHIRNMMASARSGGASEEGSEDDDDASASLSGTAALSRREKEELEFEATLQEYDSDECGSLEDPEDDPTIQGQYTLDDEDISSIMQEFMVVHEKDRTFASSTEPAEEGSFLLKEKPGGMSVYARRTNEKDEDQERTEDDGNESDESGCADYMPDYFKEKVDAKWDCESIVSTYSNLDNHPVCVTEAKKGNRKQRKEAVFTAPPTSASAPSRITLSQKSGLPVGVLPETRKQTKGDVEAGENKGQARSRAETKEEKRLRKNLVKLERQEKRASKTELKGSFKTEQLGVQARMASGGKGVAIFRY